MFLMLLAALEEKVLELEESAGLLRINCPDAPHYLWKHVSALGAW